MSKANIEKLSMYLKNNKAKLYPIENKLLAGSTDFIVNEYLRMLCVILQQAPEVTEAQLTIYNRIIAGIETDKSTEDYLRMALSVKIEDFDQFIAEIKDTPLKYRFILDAMILSCVSERDKEQIELIAAFAETFGIEKNEVRYLADIAAVILRIDPSGYVSIDEKKPEIIPENVFYGYIRLLSKKCIIKNKNLTIFQPSAEEDVTVEKLNNISSAGTPCVKLSNVKVNLSEYSLSFSGYKKVILDGCEFTGGSKHSIQFKNCENVIINNSCFKNFDIYTIYISESGSVRITGTKFEKCSYKHNRCADWGKLGGVIYAYIKNNNPIIIDGCFFQDCGGRNVFSYRQSSIICNWIAEVNNSKFINCWHYHNDTEKDPENSRRTMFPSDSKSTRCIIENSAAFC